MSKSPGGAATTPHGIDTGRRRLLVGAATLAGTVIAADALSKTETAYAAIKTALNFRERRKGVNPTCSTYLNTPATTLDISQGQSGNIQDTPTPDATVVAAQKDKTIQDDIAAQNANNWWRTNLVSLFTPLTGVAALVTIAINVWQYRKNQVAQQKAQKVEREQQQKIEKIEREKRDEDRFQTAVLGLGKEETKIGAAVTLRTFLEEGQGYEKFYQQIFELAVAYLQSREVKPDKPEPTAFDRAIIKLFVDSYKKTRDMLKKQKGSEYTSQMLDASNVRLDGAYLTRSKLEEAWLRKASFIGASLYESDLSETNLDGANLSRAYLVETNFWGANLRNAIFRGAEFSSERYKVPSHPEKADRLDGAEMSSKQELRKQGLSEEQIDELKRKGVKFDGTSVDTTQA